MIHSTQQKMAQADRQLMAGQQQRNGGITMAVAHELQRQRV